jgi:hypothetical protein
MRYFHAALIIFSATLFVARAQETTTNAPKTEIELFEAQTGQVLVKGFSQIGSISVSAGAVSVNCKESFNASGGRKFYGVAIVFTGNNQASDRLIVDYDELNSLLNGMDYLNKITYDVTSLPGFEATYLTKSGFRIVAYSSRRQGGIQMFLQYEDDPRISITSDQMAQLEGLIGQAKTTLDSLRTAK